MIIMPKDGWILIAEDSPSEAEDVVCWLREAGVRNRIVLVHTGAQALSCLRKEGRFVNRPPADPLFVLLKLRLPVYDAVSVLRTIKEDMEMMHLPVVIYAHSVSRQHLEAAYVWGVNGYLVKPRSPRKKARVLGSVGQFWAITNIHPGNRLNARS